MMECGVKPDMCIVKWKYIIVVLTHTVVFACVVVQFMVYKTINTAYC